MAGLIDRWQRARQDAAESGDSKLVQEIDRKLAKCRRSEVDAEAEVKPAGRGLVQR